MRQPTTEELKKYKYMVNLTIDVRRTDNEHLTDEENTMVQEMKKAAEEVIAGVMTAHGNKNSKHLGSETKKY